MDSYIILLNLYLDSKRTAKQASFVALRGGSFLGVFSLWLKLESWTRENEIFFLLGICAV